MSPGTTFERVYRALRDQLGSGRYMSGQHLEPAALSHDLNASITPVRDALHRLAGESLVETPRGEGFRTPLVTEIGLRHLYRWNAALLELTTRTRADHPAPTQGAAFDIASQIDATERLFLAIAGRSGNPEPPAAIARLNGRLRPIRHAELAFLPDIGAEIGEMATCLAQGAMPALRRSLAAYHRRRERRVGEIVASLVVPRDQP